MPHDTQTTNLPRYKFLAKNIIPKLTASSLILPSYYASESQEIKHKGVIDKIFEDYYSCPIGHKDIIILEKVTNMIQRPEEKTEENNDQSNMNISQTMNDIRTQNEK